MSSRSDVLSDAVKEPVDAERGSSADARADGPRPGVADPEERYRAVRRFTERLCTPLSIEDYVVQTMENVSPTKWHLAHVSWFFETFLLEPYLEGYRPLDERYAYLFNSYYVQAGERHCRDRRGWITRPTVEDVYAYREHVDEAMLRLLARKDHPRREEVLERTEVGLHHEQQHQELLLTDIKHVFSVNPLRPTYREDAAGGAGAGRKQLVAGRNQAAGGLRAGMAPRLTGGSRGGSRGGSQGGGEAGSASVPVLEWVSFPGGVHEIGHAGPGFSYDNERPRHREFLEDFALASRPVTCGEWLAFMEDGGYRAPELWLSDGWAAVQEKGWTEPFYWERTDDGWAVFTLGGLRPLRMDEPVCHLTYFEADAFARWAGARLPTEAEWEVAAGDRPVEGNFVESGILHPAPVPTGGTAARRTVRQGDRRGRGVADRPGGGAVERGEAGSADGRRNPPMGLYGDVWEWTRSQYEPYPGFRPPVGALGEYNAKFMCNQFVLRGGSCVSSRTHLRPTYRNFFHADEAWQFTGMRLAKDV